MTYRFHVWHHGDSLESSEEHWAQSHCEAARAEFDAICNNEGRDDDTSCTLLVQRENDREIVTFDAQRTVTVRVMELDREVV